MAAGSRAGRMVLAALLPGTGLVLSGRVPSGLVLGMAFALGLDAVLAWRLVWPGWAPVWAVLSAGGLAMGAWVVSVVLTGLQVSRGDPARSAEERETLFREGLAAYLRGDHEAAAGAFRAVLRLFRGDVEAHLRLALVYKARGEPEAARAALRRCRFYDADDTWRWEVERELAGLERTARGE